MIFVSFFLLVSLIHCMGFPGSTSGKERAWQCRSHKRCWFDPWVGRSPGGGHSNPLQYSYLENLTDREAWQATVPWLTKSWTQPKWLSMPTCSPLHSTIGRHKTWSHSATAPPISWTTGEAAILSPNTRTIGMGTDELVLRGSQQGWYVGNYMEGMDLSA